MNLEIQRTVSKWTPGWMKERIKELPRATHASPVFNTVNDVGALAPVVFSGEQIPGTYKIREIKSQGIPYPPKSTIPSSMVPSFWLENGCIVSFEEKNINCPNNGNSDSGWHGLHVITQTCSMIPQELIMMVRFRQNTMEIRKRIQEIYAYVWSCRARFSLFQPLLLM